MSDRKDRQKENLKAKIKSKFGSFSEFARVVGEDRYLLQKDFTTKKEPSDVYMGKLSKLCDKFERPKKKQVLTKAKLKLLKTALMHAGGVIEFCRANPAYLDTTVFAIVNERYKFTDTSEVVQNLLDHFEIK